MAARMRTIVSAIAAMMIVSLFLVSTDGLEIRSQVVPVSDGIHRFTANGGETDSPPNASLAFPGFYYDIDDDLGREEIMIKITDKKINGERGNEGLVYRTSKESKLFKFSDWGQYFTISFRGKNYFAGYDGTSMNGRVPYLYRESHHKEVLSSQMLLEVLIDDKREREFSEESPLRLDEGYELVLDEIDSHVERAYLKLLKNGREVSNGMISCSSNDENESTFKYTSNFSDIEELVTLAVHFSGLAPDGIFQLSENPIHIDDNQRQGALKFSSANASSIAMANRDNTLSLGNGTNFQIIDRIWLRTADPEEDSDKTPKMYIYLNITEPGTHEVRGLKDEINRKSYISSYTNFPGLMYDLDSNLGTEHMILSPDIYGDSGSRFRVTYWTKARDSKFKMNDWGSYYLIGFMGEKYFTGYANDKSSLSLASISGDDATNLLHHEKLSKVLTDSNEEREPIAVNESIHLDEGYILKINKINSDGIVLDLEKNGYYLENYILNLESNENTYAYHAPIDGDKKMITLAIHFKDLFNGSAKSLVTIDGIWQISDNLTTVEPNGILKIDNIDDMSVTMISEEETIRASEGRDESIMGNYYIHFADQDDGKPLRFYIIKKVTVE
jgi:S-layer protein (TIGR01567 family)